MALLFVFSTLEVNTFLYSYVPGLRAGGVSILWSIFALALIIAGMWKNVPAMRYVGLALFAVVAWKVLFFDLDRLDQFYRIIAFVILGMLVLSGSFVYLKCRPMLAAAKKEESKPCTHARRVPFAGFRTAGLPRPNRGRSASRRTWTAARPEKRSSSPSSWTATSTPPRAPAFPTSASSTVAGQEVPCVVEKAAEPRMHAVRTTCDSDVVSLHEHADSIEVIVRLDADAPAADGLTILTPLTEL